MDNPKPMQWWIVEDALRDRKGHWLEYLQTFRRGLKAEGDEARFFASRECAPDVAALLDAECVLPPSIWARMSDGAAKWRRLLRIPAHGFATYRAISKLLADSSASDVDQATPDLIFVPTVLVHHLVGWIPLIKGPSCKVPGRILLFFPNTPVHLDAGGKAKLSSDPSAKLFRWCIRWLASEVESGKVILGAETRPMAQALTEITGVPFSYFPHPVEFSVCESSRGVDDLPRNKGTLLCGAYGTARADKGSDILQKAIRQFLSESPEVPAKFVFQWIKDFRNEQGDLVSCDPWLRNHPKVQVIDELFVGEEYLAQLSKTDVLLLPYGGDYGLRVSRVVIEALVLGKPVVAPSGTTLEDQAREFGVVVTCDQNSPRSLAESIKSVSENLPKLRSAALLAKDRAKVHFSVGEFRRRLFHGNHRMRAQKSNNDN